MKALQLLVLFLALISGLESMIRESTPEGGNWTSPATWLGNSVPAATDDIVINGPVSVNPNQTCNNISITLGGTLQNPPGVTAFLYVNGDFTNRGNCINNPGGGFLDLDLRGNFNHYYVLANRIIYLRKNSGIMNLYQDEQAADISCQQFLGQSTAIGYRMLSDLRFQNTFVDLNGKDLDMTNGLGNHDLSLTGGKLYRAKLLTNGFANLSLYSGAYLHAVDAQDIILNGNSLIYLDVFFDNLTIPDYSTVSAYTAGTYNLTVRENLICRGSLSDGPSGDLYLKLYGNLENYYLINCTYVHFMSTGTQFLYQDPGAALFMPNTLGKPSSISSGEVILLSDLRTVNTNIDMNNCDIVCFSNGLDYSLTLEGGYLYRTDLLTQGFSSLSMSGGAYLHNVHGGDFILTGTIMPYIDVSFEDVVNQGTIQSYYGINHFIVNGTLHNWDTIMDGTGSDLYLHIRSDLYNNGSIICTRVDIDGPGEQNLQTNVGSAFSVSTLNLISNWGSAQFWLNGVLVYQGNTYYNITQPSPGIWTIVAGSNSRDIRIFTGSGESLPTPQIVSCSKPGERIKIVWTEVPGAYYYLVYANSDPYSPYPDYYHVWDADPGDGFVSYTLNPVWQKQFFRIYSCH